MSIMSDSKAVFSVIVPVFNSKDYLRICLDSILQAAMRFGNVEVEVIVVDNGSDDGSYELLQTEYATRTKVRQFRGVTVGGLRNRGAASSSGEFLSFIDSDCRIGPDYFEQAARILRTCADATGCQVDVPDAPHWIEKTWHEIHVYPCDGSVNYINSGNFAIKRHVFFDSGGFDEGMIGTEDAELCQRLNQKGYKVYQAHAVKATHLRGDTSLYVFFYKTAWRSLGMFGLLKNTWMTKPLFATLAHLFLCMAGIATLFLVPVSPLARFVLFATLVNSAPVATILYRGWQTKHFYAPFRATFLYHIYFMARICSMGKLVVSMDISKIVLSRLNHSQS